MLRDAGEDDDGDYLVGVRESTDAESWTLVFLECFDADHERETAPGIGSYCLVVDPGQRTCHGGVVECAVSDNELLLRLTERAADALGTPTDMRFALAVDADKLAALRRGLARVLTAGRPAV